MRTFFVGANADGRLDQVDPTGRLERDFRKTVALVAPKLFPDFVVMPFTPKVVNQGSVWQPDLAFVDKRLGYWYVVEVEVQTHDLRKHVVPQVTAFRDGDYGADASMQMAKGLGVPSDNAATLIRSVPRYVLVISNSFDTDWSETLRSENISFVSIMEYGDTEKVQGYFVEGYIEPPARSLGFGRVVASHNAVLIRKDPRWKNETYEIIDNAGKAVWDCVVDGDQVWLTKRRGFVLYEDGWFVQLMVDPSGALTMRPTNR